MGRDLRDAAVRHLPDRPLMTGSEYLRFLLVPLSFMVVFYTNYFLLIERYLFTRQTGRFLGGNALLIAAVIVGLHLLFRYVLPPDAQHPPLPRPWQDSVRFFRRKRRALPAGGRCGSRHPHDGRLVQGRSGPAGAGTQPHAGRTAKSQKPAQPPIFCSIRSTTSICSSRSTPTARSRPSTT